MNIVEALADPNLFQPHFAAASWGRWKALLTGLYGLPMGAEQATVFRALTGRETLPTEPFTEVAMCCGRRAGKTRILALIAVFLATLRDYTPYLAAGEVATIAVLAANRSQARSAFRYVSGLLNAIPMLKELISAEDGESITLGSRRVVIEISTASFRTTRGYSFAAVLCDEIAYWRGDETSANPDVEILRALRPGMASIPGSILLLASSPYAKKGALYQTFRKHYGKDDARVLVLKAPTDVLNPRIDPRIIAEAYEDDPESARAEYGAEFRDDLADFITREVVDAVTCWGRSELPPEPGVTYSAFVDPSGGASDGFAMAIGHLRDQEVCVLDAVLEIRPPFDPDKAVMECAALLRRFGVSRVVGDRYAGLWPVARFAAHGITFEQSARPKSDLYIDFLPLANAKRVELLESSRLSSQLVGLERRTARSGKDSVDHQPGAKDDLANAVAGVLVGLDLDRRPAMIRANDLLVDGQPFEFADKANLIFATVMYEENGTVSVIWACTMMNTPRLIFLDFDVRPMDAQLFLDVVARGWELSTEVNARQPGISIWAPDHLVQMASTCGVVVQPIPAALLAAGALTVSAGWHTSRGDVKISRLVAEKARTSPFGGALDFRAGSPVDGSSLRAAALFAITAALEDAPITRAAA